MSDSEEDLPPLDDFTEHFEKVKGNKDILLQERDVRKLEALSLAQQKESEEKLKKLQKPPVEKKEVKLVASKAPAADDDFMPGFRKGFLLNKRKELPKPTTSAKIEDKPIEVKAVSGSKEAAANNQRFPEVSAAMNVSSQENWVTNDQLSKVTSDEVISKGMSNPRILQALGELQQNAAKAQEKYKNDVEVTTFLTSWLKLVSNHGMQQQQQKQQQDQHKQQQMQQQAQTKKPSNSLTDEVVQSGLIVEPKPEAKKKIGIVELDDQGQEIQTISMKPQKPLIELIDEEDDIGMKEVIKPNNEPNNKPISKPVNTPAVASKPATTVVKPNPGINMPTTSTANPQLREEDFVDFNGRKVHKMLLQMWMSNPTIQRVLADPMTNQMLAALAKDNSLFPQLIKDQRIVILVKAGVLEIPPAYRAAFGGQK